MKKLLTILALTIAINAENTTKIKAYVGTGALKSDVKLILEEKKNDQISFSNKSDNASENNNSESEIQTPNSSNNASENNYKYSADNIPNVSENKKMTCAGLGLIEFTSHSSSKWFKGLSIGILGPVRERKIDVGEKSEATIISDKSTTSDKPDITAEEFFKASDEHANTLSGEDKIKHENKIRNAKYHNKNNNNKYDFHAFRNYSFFAGPMIGYQFTNAFSTTLSAGATVTSVNINILGVERGSLVPFSSNVNILSFAIIGKAQYEFKEFGGVFAYATLESCKKFSSNQVSAIHIAPSVAFGAGVFVNLK